MTLMADATVWWLATGLVVLLELFTGTFYLLMLAVGLAAGALAAHAQLGLSGQLVVAALVGATTVSLASLAPGADSDPDATLRGPPSSGASACITPAQRACRGTHSVIWLPT